MIGSVACVEPAPDRSLEEDLPLGPGIAELVIDRGGRSELEPGEGIGVAVAYSEGGQWSVTAACDTIRSGQSCRYDILVSTDETAPITAFEGRDLEAADDLFAPDDFAVGADLSTDEDTDGLGFATSPGATVRVSALLYDPIEAGFDWSDDPRIISWVGHGAVHVGAPTNPVDLTPDRP
jgi:hypothetical protein